MRSFGYLYLSWRKGFGYSRHIVGVIKIKNNATTFSYINDAVERAKKEGFTPYVEFPDLEKIYTDNVIEIFSQRLIKSERGDIGNFLKFWEIPLTKTDDKVYLIAYTQAWVPTDNFEILADFNPSKKLCFVTDLAGLSITKIDSDKLEVGDTLTFKNVSIDSDSKAVQVFKGEFLLGYIKKIHNRVFYKKGSEFLTIKVKSIEKNGVLKRVFLKVASK
ncbi:hypothetical protein ABIB62_001761 [Mucilaginibacter sp. UYP25]|uniref:hypothetical protein n=1 Tax=unclassified Mucilaginibacter TaxID=2617802 RepID=UPI0033947772